MSISEWDHREVCPDGACIGVIGDDGLCKVCGRAAPNWGNERARGLVDEPGDAAEDEDDEADDDELGADDEDGGEDEDEGEDGDEDEDDEGGDGDAKAPDDWARRELCSNGACVGVIGPDGRCTACGSAPA